MEEKNKRDRLWHRFRATGKVEDYLRYAREDDAETAEELMPETEEERPAEE